MLRPDPYSRYAGIVYDSSGAMWLTARLAARLRLPSAGRTRLGAVLTGLGNGDEAGEYPDHAAEGE
jgi:hypothetical protein